MTNVAISESKVSAAKAFIARQTPGGATLAEELRHWVEEAAYYRAEKRGFQPGYEVEDWLAAEKDLGHGGLA